jgi:hypothetical protein
MGFFFFFFFFFLFCPYLFLFKFFLVSQGIPLLPLSIFFSHFHVAFLSNLEKKKFALFVFSHFHVAFLSNLEKKKKEEKKKVLLSFF